MRHNGIRPSNPVRVLDYKRKIYIEDLPDGEYRVWNKRQLKSGCGKVAKEIKELRGCYYCKHCDEWFNKEQWGEIR